MPPPALESLPLDVAYNILSHLYQGQQSKAHPYLALSTVSKTFNGLIESYTAHLLATRRAQFASSAAPAQKATNRQRLLHHIWTYCEFCNRKSTRRAILAPELVCCKNCDQTQWPPKITMTEACKRYHLKQTDLFTAKIRFGQYYGVTGLTTLFLEPEVRELATRIHAGPGGNLETYLAHRASQSVERKAKQEEAREAKKAHLRRVLIANGLPGDTLVASLSTLLYPIHNQRPAMSVLEIVRMQLLKQRMETEISYRQYDPQSADPSRCQRDAPEYVAWDHARLWDTRMTQSLVFLQLGDARSSHDRPIHDARDRALFELFCRDFGLYEDYFPNEARMGDEEAMYLLYRSYRRMWASVSNAKRAIEMPKQTIVQSGRRARWEATIAHGQPPWSWARYPILVKDVAMEDPEPATNTIVTEDPKKAAETEKERKRVIKWNAAAEKEMSRIRALVKDRGLNMELWCKFRKPGYEVYEVEEVEAADALQVLREGGREIIVLD